MLKKPPSTKRPVMAVRTWLRGTEYELLVSNGVLHIDIFAFMGANGYLYFRTEYRRGGYDLMAFDLWRVDADGLAPSDGDNTELVQVYWTRQLAPAFNACHRTLVTSAREQCLTEAFKARWLINTVSVHCHYIRVTDMNPWPRGWLNLYRTGKGAPGSKRHRGGGPARLPAEVDQMITRSTMKRYTVPHDPAHDNVPLEPAPKLPDWL